MRTNRLIYALLTAAMLAAASCAGPSEMQMVNNGAIGRGIDRHAGQERQRQHDVRILR